MNGTNNHQDNKSKVLNNTAEPSSSNSNNTKRTTAGASTSDTRACAACKYHRRKCAPGCPLARYFPPDHQKQFLNAHKLFGLRNMMKVYNTVNPNDRHRAMQSMIIQANIRASDPVGGCHRVIQEMQKQIQFCRAELDLVLTQLAHIHSLRSAAGTGAEEPLPNPINPGMYVAGAQSMHIQPEPEDFGGYADLYAGHKDEDIQGDINPSTSYVHLSPTPLLVDGSEDIKVLFDVYEDIKHDLIESKNLNLSSEDEEPKDEVNIPKQPKQENIEDAT
nr:protein LATERAL ORGAN BOUNDARIES-like [Coffea arabica]